MNILILISLAAMLQSYQKHSVGAIDPHLLTPSQNLDEFVRKKNFGQDLTSPIDCILQNLRNSSLCSEILQDALSWSPLVYYSTSITLNNFHEIVPVIQLLQQFHRNPQLIISFRYTNQSRFLWSRLEDIYYDLSGSFENTHQNSIRHHLTAIVIDFQVEKLAYNPWDDYIKDPTGSLFYQTQYDHSYVPIHYVFPNYVRNFLQLYQPGSSMIPIGLAYTKKQVWEHGFLLPQISASDFQVLSFEFNSPSTLLISPTALNENMKTNMEKNKIFIGLGNKNGTVTVYVKVTSENLSNYNKTFSWRTDCCSYRLVDQLPYIKNVTSNFLNKLYGVQYPEMFRKNLMLWATKNDMHVIFGQPTGHDDTFTRFEEDAKIVNTTLILPYLTVNEGGMDICKLRRMLSEAKDNHEKIVLNLDAWRAAARFISQLDGSGYGHTCYDHQSNDQNTKPTSVLIKFGQDAYKIWPYIEGPLKSLLRGYSVIAGMKIDTIVFSNEDLIKPSSAILEFIRKEFTPKNGTTPSRFILGCSLSYYSYIQRMYFWDTNVDRSLNATAKLRKYMESIVTADVFNLAKIVIWEVNAQLESTFPGTETHQIFLLRKIFLEEFPDKEVIIALKNKFKEVTVMAELYNAPIILAPVDMK